MADPQATSQDTGRDTGKIAVRDTGADGARRAAGEPRAFAEGLAAPGMTAPVAVEAGRAMAETARRSGMEALGSFMGLQMDMNRWFDDMWRQAAGFTAFSGMRTGRPFAGFSAAPLMGLPACDLLETDKDYTLSVELPGLKAEDVDVQTGGGRLTVCGRKREEGDERVGAYRVSERRFGQFERSFPIPADAESSRVDAAFRDGLLTVVLPKRAEAAGRAEHVQVKAARG